METEIELNQNQLEQLVDRYGVPRILTALAEVCALKAEHVETNWQDKHPKALMKTIKTVRDWKGVLRPAPVITGRLCEEREDLGIRLIQHGRDSFAVVYGLQVKDFLNYGQAALEYGSCVMHALAGDGKLDSRTKGAR